MLARGFDLVRRAGAALTGFAVGLIGINFL
jgi:hypothetical protein